jgi:hypothetical protein
MKRLFTILLIAVGAVANSQIAATRPTVGVASTTNTNTYALAAFTPTANSLLVVMVYATGTVITTPTVTGGSLTWTREVIQVIGSNEQAIFWARVGGSPVSTTITFDCTGDNATGAIVEVVQFTGYDATTNNPIKQAKTSTATTTSTNANVVFATALGTSNGYYITWSAGLAANSSAPPSGWTESNDLAYSTPASNAAGAYRAGGETGTTYTFTSASSTWTSMGVEVYVSGAGPISSKFFF